ncbi:head maturation protease, ClpP-related [Lachnotalea glycerini]|uniref:head maturation protease, ClpP-related n=1 Tax=Lachnotalea glycerini TaxID=1763509 RepID=UPI0015F25380|nr:head maturation protease, ClpP-related [Lachnotalea glycerini]
MSSKVLDIKGAIVSNDDKWIYDWLGYDAVCPKDVINFIRGLDGEELIIEINSGGGDVFAASEMYAAIINYKGKVITKCVGLAGSAASVLLTASENEIAPTSMVMIHNTQGGARGDYHVLDKGSQILKQANKTIMAAYKIKSHLSESELIELMDKESWLTAEEAVNNGFCDRIMKSQNSNHVISGTSSKINNYRPIVLNATKIIDKETIEKMRNTIKNRTSFENNVLPEELPKADQEEHFLINNSEKERNKMMEANTTKEITTVKDLHAAYPELVKQLTAEASLAAQINERSRIQEIDNIAKNLQEDIVNDAKYINPVTAETLALQALKANETIGNTVLNNMISDIEASGANNVTASANSGLHDSNEELKAKSQEKVKGLAAAFAKRK